MHRAFAPLLKRPLGAERKGAPGGWARASRVWRFPGMQPMQLFCWHALIVLRVLLPYLSHWHACERCPPPNKHLQRSLPRASSHSHRCHPRHLPSGSVGGPAHQPVPLHPQRTAPHHWVHRRLCGQHRTGCQCGRAGRGSSGRRQEGCSVSSRAGELAQRSSVRGSACTSCKRLRNAAGVGAL